MAEVMALGITHYPPMATPDDKMSWIIKYMMTNPNLPPEMRDRSGWSDAMIAEWGDDEGTAAAGRHRAELVGWMNKVRDALDAFKPDYVLMFGDDQYENFKEDVVPPYCICAFDEFTYSVPAGNVWGDPADRKITVPGVPKQAKRLASTLIEEGFDAAYAYKPLHHPLGHAFNLGLMYLDYQRDKGWPYPILPVSINCYGRKVIAQRGGLPKFDRPFSEDQLDPPAPTPRRLFDLGAAIGRAVRDGPDRVAILAASGWSHAFLVDKHHGLYPDQDADQRMFDAMMTGDYEVWKSLTGSEVEDAGQQELLNWSCLVGAMSELNLKPLQGDLVKTWIFNSNKAFIVTDTTG
jgi:hypothetical protein